MAANEASSYELTPAEPFDDAHTAVMRHLPANEQEVVSPFGFPMALAGPERTK